MLEPPPLGSLLTAPGPRLNVWALRAAEQELLASQQAARRALDVINAYETRHGEEPLTR